MLEKKIRRYKLMDAHREKCERKEEEEKSEDR